MDLAEAEALLAIANHQHSTSPSCTTISHIASVSLSANTMSQTICSEDNSAIVNAVAAQSGSLQHVNNAKSHAAPRTAEKRRDIAMQSSGILTPT
eukprot:IDg2249t1